MRRCCAARRRALNVLRHRGVEQRHLPLLVEDGTVPGPGDLLEDPPGVEIPDDRLRLVVTCCHPALDRSAQVALTLRLMCGLSTAEVARAFLVPESTMAARITRAKKKIAVARIPYRVPSATDLPERVDAVLSVVHLLFTTGHAPRAGDEVVRRDLVERSVELGRMLRRLLPEDPAVAGLLALLLLTDARRETRAAPDGRLLLLAEQDRGRWDRRAIAEGVALVREGAAGAAAHALRPAGRHRGRARRVAVVGRHRLAGDRGALRRPGLGVALAGRRAQPRRRRQPGRGRGGGTGRRRRVERGTR